MQNKTIGDLRNVMFDAMQKLMDGKIDVTQAKAVSDIGQVMINSAKVEVDYIRAVGGDSAFIKPKLPAGVIGVTRHTLEG